MKSAAVYNVRAMASDPPDSPRDEMADPTWFREPTRREHSIGAGLFVGFGLFFVASFFVLAGLVFRWVFLGLGAFSILRGAWHFGMALTLKEGSDESDAVS